MPRVFLNTESRPQRANDKQARNSSDPLEASRNSDTERVGKLSWSPRRLGPFLTFYSPSGPVVVLMVPLRSRSESEVGQ